MARLPAAPLGRWAALGPHAPWGLGPRCCHSACCVATPALCRAHRSACLLAGTPLYPHASASSPRELLWLLRLLQLPAAAAASIVYANTRAGEKPVAAGRLPRCRACHKPQERLLVPVGPCCCSAGPSQPGLACRLLPLRDGNGHVEGGLCDLVGAARMGMGMGMRGRCSGPRQRQRPDQRWDRQTRLLRACMRVSCRAAVQPAPGGRRPRRVMMHAIGSSQAPSRSERVRAQLWGMRACMHVAHCRLDVSRGARRRTYRPCARGCARLRRGPSSAKHSLTYSFVFEAPWLFFALAAACARRATTV